MLTAIELIKHNNTFFRVIKYVHYNYESTYDSTTNATSVFQIPYFVEAPTILRSTKPFIMFLFYLFSFLPFWFILFIFLSNSTQLPNLSEWEVSHLGNSEARSLTIEWREQSQQSAGVEFEGGGVKADEFGRKLPAR